MTHVGKRLREFRKSVRMTQEELAFGICNRSYVSQIEKGQVIPSPEILEQLAKRLQKDLQELWLEAPNLSFTQVEIQNALKHVINRIDENEWEMARKWIFKLHETPLTEKDQCKYLWSKARIAEHDGIVEDVEDLYLQSLQIGRNLQDNFIFIRALDSLGYFYCKQNQAHKAVSYLYEAYQYVHQLDITGILRIGILYHLGLAHQQLKEYHAAIVHLRKAEQLNNSTGTYYKNSEINLELGKCYIETNQYEEALIHLHQAETLFSLFPQQMNQVDLYSSLGLLYYRLGEMDTAIEHYQHALPLQESETEESSSELLLQLAQAYRDDHQFDQAKQIWLQLMNSSTSGRYSLVARVELAKLLVQEGLDQEAIQVLMYNLENLPVEAYLMIARIYQKHGRSDEAIQLLEQRILL